MATQGTIIRENAGSLTLRIVPFTTITTGDTWDSGLGNQVVTYQYQEHYSKGTGTCVANSAGTFTFYNSGITAVGEGDLFIYTKD